MDLDVSFIRPRDIHLESKIKRKLWLPIAGKATSRSIICTVEGEEEVKEVATVRSQPSVR